MVVSGPLTIGQTATPHVLGYMMNWGLFGALVVQVYIYYLAFPNDRRWIKCLVGGVAVIETVQTAFMSHDAVMALGIGFGDPMALDSVHFGWLTIPLITSIVSTVVQCFFAWRIYMLSKVWAISTLIVLLSLSQGAASLAQGILSIRFNRFSILAQNTKTTGAMWLVGAAVCDVVIAISMSWTLSRSRKQTGSKRLDAVLTRLICLTIETGSATATMAVLTAVMFLIFKQADFFVTSSYVLAKLYTNNLLMILNSRVYIENGRNGRPPDDPSFVSFRKPTTIRTSEFQSTDDSNFGSSDENAENSFQVIPVKVIEASSCV